MLQRLTSNSLLTGSLVYFFTNLLNAAIPFALLPILTRYLSPEEYGEVAMFQTLMGLLTAFVGLSLAGAAGRKFYDGDGGYTELRQFIGSCFQILTLTTLLTLGVVALLQNLLTDYLGLPTEWIFGAVIATAANIVIQIRLGQWQVRKKALSYGAMQLSSSALNMTLSLIAVVILLSGASGRIFSNVLSVLIVAAIAFWLLKREGLLELSVWSPTYIKEALKFGVPLIPHVGGLFLLSSVDRFFINAELGLAEAGVYMVAVQISGVAALVFDAINKAFVPWLFEKLKRNVENEKRKIVRYTYAWYLFILLGALLSFSIAPSVVKFIAGDKYSTAGHLVGWLVLGQVFGGMYLMVTNYIFFSKRTGLLSLATIFSGLLNVALIISFIRLFGLVGAAYAYCISMGVRFLLTWFVAQHRHPMPWYRAIK